MSLTSAEDAIARYVGPNDTIVIAPGLGEPQGLVRALAAQSERLAGARVLAGLLLEDYPFADPQCLANLRFDTWHVTAPIRDLVKSGQIGFIPLRASTVVPFLESVRPDVLLCSVSPERAGYHSFGASVSFPLPVARCARRVLAEVQPSFPFAVGDSALPVSVFTALVEPEGPPRVYREASVTEDSRRIAAHVWERIPDGATLQLGIGVIPEALLGVLREEGTPRDLSLWGFGVETMIELLGRGLLAPTDGRPPFIGAELMGTDALLRLAHDNPMVQLYPSGRVLNPLAMAEVKRFVSVNTAVEVDLAGNVNSEVLLGTQISGSGGSADFVQGATLSPGGRSIIAMTSTAGEGRHSRIVPRLPAGCPSTIPRHSVQFVVTEYGATDLTGKTMGERAEALISIAHPAHRQALEQAL